VVERLHRGNEPIESILGPSQTLQARFDRSQPSPISRRGNQARGEVKVGDSDGDRGRLHLRTEMFDEGAHWLRRDTLGRSRREVVSIVRLQEAKPPPIGKLDGLARAFCKVSARSSGLVEDVSWLVGGAEGLAVGLRPLVLRKMLKRSHVFYFPLLVLHLERISLRASRCLNRCWLYARLARRLDEPA